MSLASPDNMVLAVQDLRVHIEVDGFVMTPVSGVSLQLHAGECLGLVGESGSGKSLTLKALMGLLPANATVEARTLEFACERGQQPRPFRPHDVRGRGIGMVFQEPMTALNPMKRVIDLIAEGPRHNLGLSKREAHRRALELMVEVGIPDAASRARAWPWQLSGGLRQRVMIAMALASEPRVLFCDEPTTALDVSVQDQVLRLIDRLRREHGLAVLFVTHDLAVVRQIAHRVAVMYAGRIIEAGTVDDVFLSPRHPYTRALLQAAPALDRPLGRLATIPGAPPDPGAFPTGCRFAPRCELAREHCSADVPRLIRVGAAHEAACARLEETLVSGARE